MQIYRGCTGKGPTLLDCFLAAASALVAVSVMAAESEPDSMATRLGGLDNEKGSTVSRSNLGFEWRSADNRFMVNPWLRLQTRYSDPFDSDPRSLAAMNSPPGRELDIRRARLKVEGHVFSPAVGFYYEQELSGDRPLLDLRIDLELIPSLLLRAGQYKVLYNRERVDSSGKQQFIERSIATYAFTLDRQRGVTVAKHLAEGTRFDNWLMLGVMEGDSRDPGPRGDDPMMLARWQWQFLGEDLPFAQSDFAFRSRPAGSLAFAYARITGPYTRFSSSGGGQLDGFTTGGDDRYVLTQWLQEFAWQFRGYSFQQELHFKNIEDREGNEDGELTGGYLQFGKAWKPTRSQWPLEVALRYAQVDWDTLAARKQEELSLVLNVFFSGHNNKVSAEIGQLKLDMSGQQESNSRFRFQWDFSF